MYKIDVEIPMLSISNENRLNIKIADEEMQKEVIDTIRVCSTCDQYDSPWGCCYNAHPICNRIFEGK